jgi:hypothetical protein
MCILSHDRLGRALVDGPDGALVDRAMQSVGGPAGQSGGQGQAENWRTKLGGVLAHAMLHGGPGGIRQ